MTPVRIQRKRSKDWRKPANSVIVDRTTKWGNPFIVGKHGTQAECVDLFVKMLRGWFCISIDRETLAVQRAYPAKRIVAELKGKNLLCWCAPDKKCHADVLLKLANEDAPE